MSTQFRAANQHRPATDQLTRDLLATLDQHPMAFDVIVFPAASDKEEVADGMDDVVGNLESDERQLDYGEPIVTQALEPNHSIEFRNMLNAGDGYGVEGADDPWRLLIKGRPVPKRSVLAYVVDTGSGLALQVMYIMGAQSIARRAPAGYLYQLIPYLGGMKPLDALPGGEVTQEAIVEQLDGLLTFDSKATSMEPSTGPSDDSKIAELRDDIDGQRFTYESREPATTHVVNHGLDSMFVQTDIWIQDADGHYYRDVVNAQETNPNRLTVSLPDPANVKVVVKKGESF